MPFRLTRGLAGALGPAGLLGPFAASFTAADRAAFTSMEVLWPLAALLYRDDSWEAAGAPAVMAPSPGGGPSTLVSAPTPQQEAAAGARRVQAHVAALFARLSDAQSPSVSSKLVTRDPSGPGGAAALSVRVLTLAGAALGERGLARMPPGWHAWW